MIVSKLMSRLISRCLGAGVLLCAMIVLPLGIASAADYEAVERKLGEIVAEGHLSLDEAKLMLDTLRKTGGKKASGYEKKQSYKKQSYKKENSNLDGAWKKLQMMVKEGKITEAQARQKMAAMKKGAYDKREKGAYEKHGKSSKGGGDERMHKFKQIEEKIYAAVEAGNMSKGNAHEHLAHLKRELFGGEHRAKGGKAGGDARMRTYKEIEAAVRAGKLSKEDAQKKLAHLKGQTFSGKHPDKRGQGGKEHGDERAKRFRKIEEQIYAAVKAGKMSKEDAHKKLGNLKREIFGGEGGKNAKGDGDERMRKYREIEVKLHKAVESGKMSKEDAMRKLGEIKKQIFGGEQKRSR